MKTPGNWIRSSGPFLSGVPPMTVIQKRRCASTSLTARWTCPMAIPMLLGSASCARQASGARNANKEARGMLMAVYPIRNTPDTPDSLRFPACGRSRGKRAALREFREQALQKCEEHIHGVSHQKRDRQRRDGDALPDRKVIKQAHHRASDGRNQEPRSIRHG